MHIVEKKVTSEHERVRFCEDASTGYRGIIAIHNTVLGPALGGTRYWRYLNDKDALTDALRLARGMTYKNALAGLPFGGGKSVILAGGGQSNRELLFRAHGRFVETFGGRYITAEDVGTTTDDMTHVRKETTHVAGLADRSGDPSPVTARGVFRALQASAKYRWGSDDLSGKSVALQGCGHVGYYLASELHRAGARLVATDIDRDRVARVVRDFNAVAVGPEEIYDIQADVFSPCGLGGILNDGTIPRLKVEMVVGAANNQLLDEQHGDLLAARGISYAPDFVANAGGVINGCIELLGWGRSRSAAQVEQIYDTVLKIFEIADSEGLPTYKAANNLAERRFTAANAAAVL
jgi:leucine dehydrogenase